MQRQNITLQTVAQTEYMNAKCTNHYFNTWRQVSVLQETFFFIFLIINFTQYKKQYR